jgi:hypothetical protein
MINPADDEINLLIPVMTGVFVAFFIIIGVVIYKVFDLGSAIRRNGNDETVGVLQAVILSFGGVVLVMIAAFVLGILIEIGKAVLSRVQT